MPLVLFIQPTTGPLLVLTMTGLSAVPVPLIPLALRDVPRATHPPAPALAVGSYLATRISLADAPLLNSVQAIIGWLSLPIVRLGRREDVSVLLTPPPC